MNTPGREMMDAMSETLTLVEFLQARIAEDEARARDRQADAMMGHRWKGFPPEAYEELQATVLTDTRCALADCAAKRRIVEAYRALRIPTDEDRERLSRDHPNAAQYAPTEWYEGLRYGLAEAVQNLAAVYAGHPDYRDEWRP